MTAMLDEVLIARGTKLGRELAAFWGEHLKEHPAHPPAAQLARLRRQAGQVARRLARAARRQCGWGTIRM